MKQRDYKDATDLHAVTYGLDEEQNGYEELMGCLKARTNGGGFEGSVSQNMQVRRLTPTECERLQAFPSGYTNIPGASDSARYKALGNSMACNCMQYLAQNIELTHYLSS